MLGKESRGLGKLADQDEDPEREGTLRREAALLADFAQEQELSRLLLPQNPDVGTVVQPASRATATSEPSRIATAAVGLLIGLVAGVAVALIARFMDERPRTPGELESLVKTPVLACIPHARIRRKRKRSRLIALAAPSSVAAETYRVLRTLIEPHRHNARVLLVASADAGEGKSTVAANLAVSLVEDGHRVVLVCCNPLRPMVPKLFRLPEGPGLVDVLTAQVVLQDALRSPGPQNLRVLTAGVQSGRSSDFLASPLLRAVVKDLTATSDLVILDGPPILAGADALAVAVLSEAVLFVADTRLCYADRVTEARRQLEGVGARLIGAVLNNCGKAAGTPTHLDPATAGSSVPALYS
jgi:capsular exopolysaccharide synthesis family protein